MKLAICLSVICMSLFVRPGITEETAPWSLASRLAGCWEGSAGMEYTEHWMKPSGGIMLGMSRTVRPGKATTIFEFIRIAVVDGKLAYIAMPSDQAEATFKLASSSGDEMVFEDPAHDFPQRVVYRFLPDNGLLARIEGKVNGSDRAVDFPMKRVACP